MPVCIIDKITVDSNRVKFVIAFDPITHSNTGDPSINKIIISVKKPVLIHKLCLYAASCNTVSCHFPIYLYVLDKSIVLLKEKTTRFLAIYTL